MGFVAVGTAWGFKKQTDFGTAATPDKWIPFISESIAKNYDKLEIVDSESRFQKNNGGPLGRMRVEGDVNTYIEVNNVGYPLFFLMGSCYTTSGLTFNTHKFTVANEIPYFTSEFKYGTVADAKGKKAISCKMKGATFDFADDMLTSTWNIHAADYSGNVVTTTVTNPTGRKFTYKDLRSGTTPGIIVTVGGTTYSGVKIKTGSLSLDNGLITDDYYQGSQTVQQLDAGKFSVTGSFELIFDNAADLVSWLEGSEAGTVEIRYEGNIISGSDKESIIFLVPNAWVTSHSVPMTNNEVIVRQVEFEGFYNAQAAGAKTIEITLKNTSNTVATGGNGYA